MASGSAQIYPWRRSSIALGSGSEPRPGTRRTWHANHADGPQAAATKRTRPSFPRLPAGFPGRPSRSEHTHTCTHVTLACASPSRAHGTRCAGLMSAGVAKAGAGPGWFPATSSGLEGACAQRPLSLPEERTPAPPSPAGPAEGSAWGPGPTRRAWSPGLQPIALTLRTRRPHKGPFLKEPPPPRSAHHWLL